MCEAGAESGSSAGNKVLDSTNTQMRCHNKRARLGSRGTSRSIDRYSQLNYLPAEVILNLIREDLLVPVARNLLN